MVLGLAGSFNFLDLLSFESPQSQLLSRGAHSSLSHFPHDTQLCILDVLYRLKCLEKLLLRTDQLRAVEINHMVTLVDGDPRVIHIKSIQPAGKPRRNIGEPGFVIIHLAYHAHDGGYEFTLNRSHYDIHQFFGIFADGQLTHPAAHFTG